MPSRPMRQTCANTVGPSSARCSLYRMACLDLRDQSGSRRIAVDQWQAAKVFAVMLDQIEGVQHRLTATPSRKFDCVLWSKMCFL